MAPQMSESKEPDSTGSASADSDDTVPVRRAAHPVVPAQTDAASAPDGQPAPEALIPRQTPGAVDDAATPGASADSAAKGVEAEGGEDGLSDRDREVLEFEKKFWKYAGSKEQAIRERFGLSASRYYQVLNALLDRPEALESEPALVKRLRRMRAVRQRSRGTVPPAT